MSQKILIPITIIIAGILVAGAVLYSGKQPVTPTDGPIEIAVNPVDQDDWIRGNVDAKVKIIEYSDPECPFCKNHQITMNEIIQEYDPSDFAWVYRHLPLTTLHSKAGTEAAALECAGRLGGQDAFWNYTNQIYAETPTNNGLNLDRLPTLAEEQGLDRAAFEACLSDQAVKDEVQKDAQNAFDSATHLGGKIGTPYNVLVSDEKLSDAALAVLNSIADQYNRPNQIIVTISDDEKRATLSGALPKDMIKSVLDAALGK